MKKGQEVEIEIASGQMLIIKLVAIQDIKADGTRTVVFEVNGESWYMPITDLTSKDERVVREKATDPGQVGSPMSGVIVGLKVKAGDKVKEGEAVLLVGHENETSTCHGVWDHKRDCQRGDKVDGE
jgi:pyruvate carboxylase